MVEVALVTGAARGIGLATTRRFVNQGMRVAMVDRDGDVLRQEAAQFGDAVVPLEYDISVPEQVSDMVGEFQSHFAGWSGIDQQCRCCRFWPDQRNDI